MILLLSVETDATDATRYVLAISSRGCSVRDNHGPRGDRNSLNDNDENAEDPHTNSHGIGLIGRLPVGLHHHVHNETDRGKEKDGRDSYEDSIA